LWSSKWNSNGDACDKTIFRHLIRAEQISRSLLSSWPTGSRERQRGG
jgi:hypothetical protein